MTYSHHHHLNLSKNSSSSSRNGSHLRFDQYDNVIFACGNNERGILGIDDPFGEERKREQQRDDDSNDTTTNDRANNSIVEVQEEEEEVTLSSHVDHFLSIVPYFTRDYERLRDPVVCVRAGYLSAYWLTRCGNVFVTGDNTGGACGLAKIKSGFDGGSGDRHHVRVPTRFQLPSNEPVRDVSCGASHSLILTVSGALWSCGSNDYGQLGYGIEEQVRYVPRRVTIGSNQRVASISAGYNHSLAITESGELWSFGGNNLGQNGTGSSNSVNTIPTKIVFDVSSLPQTPTFNGVWTGNNHTIVRTSSGRLYSVGCNSDGRLALGDSVDRNKFTEIQLPETPVKDVICGSWHTICILNDSVYSSGSNTDCQCGYESSASVLKLRHVPLPDWLLEEKRRTGKRLSVACGEAFTVIYLHREESSISRHFSCMKSTISKHSSNASSGFKDVDVICLH